MKNTTLNNLISDTVASKRVQEFVGKTALSLNGKRSLTRLSDMAVLKPEDILSLFHQKKLNEKDTMFWLGVLAVNAEEKAKKHEQLATMDELTQVYNRRAFIDNLSKELSRLRSKHLQIQKLLEEPMTLTLMIVDIDFFKKVNDKYGHLAGDQALRGVADVLKKQVRDTDSVFRYGGEEFTIVMPDTPREEALDAAKRINRAIAKANILINQRKKKYIKATVSVGVTSIDGHQLADMKVTDMMIPKMIAQADEALYFAKGNGRNQVTMWTKKIRNALKNGKIVKKSRYA
ncbi:MAG: GGDEF domain-containing protein [Patescibacteria group bacterium]|nr:GGDEF domain-containing protein [Patescibacteria group bacterium]